MKVLYIFDGEYPWDIRAEKITSSLRDDGHEVYILCRNKSMRKRFEDYKGVRIHRTGTSPFGKKKFNDAWTFPAFFSPVWLHEIFRLLRNSRMDLIIVRDLPLALSALFAGKLYEIPTVLDMAECYPEMLRCTWQFEGVKFKNIFLRNPLLADIVEKITIKNADCIFVMVKESQDRLWMKGVSRSRTYIVSNTPEVAKFDRAYSFSHADNRENNQLHLLYVGLVNPSRGLDNVVDAVSAYTARIGKIDLKILGEGKAKAELERKVKRLRLENTIHFLGWVENTEVPKYIQEADVCIIPHHRCTHWDNTVPNKLFDYMAAGRPVLATDVPPIVDILNRHHCGYVYQDNNVADLVDKLGILTDEKARRTMGENGRKAVLRKYNWEREKAVMYRAIERLSPQSSHTMP